MNTAIYLRVSTQEQKQHGISVDAQEAACRAWTEEHGHRLVGVYNDAGLSARAKYTKRRELLRLLDDVSAGNVELVIFTKLDRWFRNVGDYYQVQAILEAHGVRWRAIQEDYETETASGRFKVNIMLAVAQDEADRTSERIKAAADYKRARGEAVGRPALGYRIEDKHWTIDPETRDGVAAFFDAYLATFSVRGAMRAAAAHGIRLNATHAGRILRNPTYHGDAFGVPCPAYVTAEQFDLMRKHAGARTRKNRTGRVFLFTGLLRCGCCGGSMTSGAMTKSGHEVKYYRCLQHYQSLDVCPAGSYANEVKLETWLKENLSEVLGDYAVSASAPEAIAKKRTSAKTVQGKLSRLRDLFIDGDIDRADYDRRAAALRAELAELDAESPEPPAITELPPDWAATYDALPEEFKKVFWKKAVRKIVIKKDQPPLVVF